ncbi:DMT family transporter [Lysobacter pythonis]|uniref:DMT family transporter n=1 Tax=Solilutibacter pythonis TaxID=2483112 RepID=A0A3M2I137_9GAMM|nr:DMT family transporter [Lysobacter pythonis]RMH93369.1 DMT family transporter [Lysobacter pythonis]
MAAASLGLGGRDFALLILVCLIWALNFLMSAIGLREIPPITFTLLRFVVLLAALAVFLRLPPPGQRVRLFSVSLLIGVVHFGLSFLALYLAGEISSAAIVMQSYIPMTTLLAWWWLGEKFGWRTALAIGISFTGVLVLGLDPKVLAKPAALLTMLASALALALGTVMMKGLRGIDMFNQQGWMAATSVPPLLALSLWREPGALFSSGGASPMAWLGVAYAALASSLLGHGIYFRLVQRHPVALMMPWLLLVPVIAVALGIAFWGDRPGPRVFAGGAMVLGGVLTIALRKRARVNGLAEI